MNTLMKAAALAATTAVVGGAAYAQAAFGVQETVMDDRQLTLNLVVADEAGFVAIFDYTDGELGEQIGSAPINAGANQGVQVILDRDPSGPRVAAFVFAGDQTDPMMADARMTIDVE